MNNLEKLIEAIKEIEKDGEPKLPFQLHNGIRACADALGGYKYFREFLEKVNNAEL